MPGFLSTIVLALLRKGGRCLSPRLALVKSVSALATGSPRALRKLNGISSSPGAELEEHPANIAEISSIVVDCSTVKDSLGLRESSSERSA